MYKTLRVETNTIIRCRNYYKTRKLSFYCCYNDENAYPCTIDYIKKWIIADLHAGGDNSGYFVISLKEINNLIGVIGLEVDLESERAELGYWLGLDYWNNGYCTEAARAMVEYGFNILHLNRIWTFYIEGNSASGKVLEKIGMQHEGTLKKHIKKNGLYKDLEYYGIVKGI